jgi:hypothetical protein
MVVDQNGTEIGIATDPYGGLLLRHVGNDAIVFWATSAGPTRNDLVFYHAKSDCSDDRYVRIQGGAGFAYYAEVRDGAAFYTKTQDPLGLIQVAIQASESFGAADDATRVGACVPFDGGTLSLGVVTMAPDPALMNPALPLRLK